MIVSAVVSTAGILVWGWSVYLILTRLPRRQLITTGPYALMKHPLYTGAALLVLPWVGFLCNTWLGVVIGAVIYGGCRLYAPEEERVLSRIFGAAWQQYAGSVLMPWL